MDVIINPQQDVYYINGKTFARRLAKMVRKRISHHVEEKAVVEVQYDAFKHMLQSEIIEHGIKKGFTFQIFIREHLPNQ